MSDASTRAGVRANLHAGATCRHPCAAAWDRQPDRDTGRAIESAGGICLARSLGRRAGLLDEPTEGIQLSIIKQIGEVIGVLRQLGKMAIVLVEQYFDFAVQLADRVTVLNRGTVVETATRQTLDRERLFAAVSL